MVAVAVAVGVAVGVAVAVAVAVGVGVGVAVGVVVGVVVAVAVGVGVGVAMKYRKKPIIVDAFKWTGDENQTEDSIWIINALQKNAMEEGAARCIKWNTPDRYMTIKTLEGEMSALPGDYIIRGIKGEIYPCKPDIFEAIYEKVEE